MRLLKITRQEYPGFDSLFQDSDRIPVEEAAPAVIDGECSVKLDGRNVSDYDAVFAEIPRKNAVFGRVLLETLEEKNLALNYPSTAFFTMAKKNYLYYVLQQRNIDCPGTAVIASEKAGRNIHQYLETPMVARKFDHLVEVERKKLEKEAEINGFIDGTEYPEQFIILQEYTEGEKYRCLYAGGDIISLLDSGETRAGNSSLKYSNVSKDQRETVEKTARSIGAPVAEVVLVDGKVQQVNPNPDIQTYTDVSGKNAHQAIADVLKGDRD